MPRAETDVLISKDNQWAQIYRCSGQEYWLDAATCDGRQQRGYFASCLSCPVRAGGKDDPRAHAGGDLE